MTAPEREDAAVPLAGFVAALGFDDLDPDTVDAAKRLTLDCLGAGIAAAFEPGVVELRALATEWGGKPEATLLASGVRVPAHHAVAANTTACRALEIDDVHEEAVIHTSATVVPVALAAAERSQRPVSGRDLIAAIVAGTEVANRVSLASRVETADGFRPRTWSSTNLVGTLAAAVTAAKVARADAATTLHALGYGYSNAAATKQGLADQAPSVRVQHGVCVANGVFGATLALRGLTGPTHPLEGRFGFYPSFWGGAYDRDVLLDGLGERFTVTGTSIKPYPCCKFTHTAVAAAIAAARDARFTAERVRRVVVTLESEEYFATVCAPLDVKRRPATTVEAQFSLPYCAGVGLTRGGVGLGDFEAPLDPAALRLAGLTECVLAESPERRVPSPARVAVELDDGTAIAAEAACAPGHPDAPFGWPDVVAKLEACCAFADPAPPAVQVRELAATIRDLEAVEDVGDLPRRLLVW